MPLMSAIVTCKGRLEHLKQTLPLLMAMPDSEVIVVDYDCPDRSGDWVRAEHPGAVKSPMVGTAYLRPSPESKAFVEIGAMVKAGEKILLVEAMKTFNEILAPKSGRVAQILVEDGTPVEYGQALMVIE